MIMLIRREFERFLRQLIDPLTGRNLATYPDGYAIERPQGQAQAPPFPYTTYTMNRDDIYSTGIWTVKVWTDYQTPDVVDDICGQLDKILPEAGAVLDLGENGRIILRRHGAFIQPLPQDEQRIRAALCMIEARSHVL